MALLPALSMTKEVLRVVEAYAWRRHSTIPRSIVIDQWALSDEEYEQCVFDEHGYLIVGVTDLHIAEMKYEDGIQVWYVECRIDLGYDLSDSDGYSAYQDSNGEWCIQWEYS